MILLFKAERLRCDAGGFNEPNFTNKDGNQRENAHLKYLVGNVTYTSELIGADVSALKGIISRMKLSILDLLPIGEQPGSY